MIRSERQPTFKPNIYQNFSGQSLPSEPKLPSQPESKYLPSPSAKSIPIVSDREEKLKELLNQVYTQLLKVQSEKYKYYEPDLFISIYKIKKEIENESFEFTELIQKHPELKEINDRIANIFLKKEVADWLFDLTEIIPFYYLSGNFKAEDVYKAISGVKFTFDFWNETYDGKKLKNLCDEAFKWARINSDWPGPSWCLKREFNRKELNFIPEFVPTTHWWWGIPKKFIDCEFLLECERERD
jgi:hypothetical protein